MPNPPPVPRARRYEDFSPRGREMPSTVHLVLQCKLQLYNSTEEKVPWGLRVRRRSIQLALEYTVTCMYILIQTRLTSLTLRTVKVQRFTRCHARASARNFRAACMLVRLDPALLTSMPSDCGHVNICMVVTDTTMPRQAQQVVQQVLVHDAR